MSEEANRTIAVYRSLDELPPAAGRTVAAVGNFDGVHRGHQEILSSAAEEARVRSPLRSCSHP